MKIFDCVTFFNEFDQLRLRMALLEDRVDHFVVVEARQTHTGQTKPLHLAGSGDPLLAHPKLTAHAVDLPADGGHWNREQHQRDCIGEVLAGLDAAPGDVVMVSDVDEIPAPQAVARARDTLAAAAGRTLLAFEQRLFYFRLNYELVWSRKLPWLGTVAARYGDAPSVNGLRTTARRARGAHARGFDASAKVFQVPRGGWHFSYLGDDSALERKLAAYAHQESGVQSSRGASVRSLIDARASLFPRKGVEEVWALVEPGAVGMPAAAVARAGVGGLFEAPHDTTDEILERVRAVAVPRRGAVGKWDFGYSRRGHWPRLPGH